ncbi:MAG: sugar-binding transcriptional regulator [Actinobacteria bacterium]|nr:sugar-binding transcriptional regulator [Actinomycetota bacterium]
MNDIEKNRFLGKIARLYYLEGLTQQEVAGKLNISRTRVSRYLEKARENNIVEIKINSPGEDYSRIEYLIEKTFKIKECVIAPTLEKDEAILQSMAESLNNLLSRILKDECYMGIGWGSSLSGISKYINISNKKGIKVVPMIGGLGKIGTGVHTNSVAKKIADRLGGISYMIHAPAVLDSKKIKETVEKDSNVREIMEMAGKISTALIGLSDLGMDSTLIKTGNFSPGEFDYLSGLGVIGDVNLIFIDKNGRHVQNRLDDRIVRIPLNKLKKIENVIGVAFGRRKTPVILGALKGGIINILFTDLKTANEVLKYQGLMVTGNTG